MSEYPGITLLDQTLLRTATHLVPAAEKEDFARAWHAELWHLHQSSRQRNSASASLANGILRDALWLRVEAARRALDGTATLCLATLVLACAIALLTAFLLAGDSQQLATQLTPELRRFLLEAPLLALVTFATISRSRLDRRASPETTFPILRRHLFFACKATMVLLLAFLAGADLCLPLHSSLPLAAELLQTLATVLLALTGLRWAIHDQQERCRHCLTALTSPARIGRPSHNLLEWNGTEQLCRHGHGRLNLPEMETSWCRHGQWLAPETPQPA